MTFRLNDDDRLWKQTKSEGWFRYSPPFRYIILLVLLVCLILGLWYIFSPARRNFNPTTLALITADESPYKVKAEDQGVPGIKHQDKLVYGRIRGDHDTHSVEHILPDPEVAEFKGEDQPMKMVEQYLPGGEKSENREPTITSISELIDDIPSENKEYEMSPRVDQQKAKGNILIQLGSLDSEELAEIEWGRLSKKHKDILGSLQSNIQRVDLGESKGIKYCLKVGYFTTLEEAQKTCVALKERKVECIVIH